VGARHARAAPCRAHGAASRTHREPGRATAAPSRVREGRTHRHAMAAPRRGLGHAHSTPGRHGRVPIRGQGAGATPRRDGGPCRARAPCRTGAGGRAVPGGKGHAAWEGSSRAALGGWGHAAREDSVCAEGPRPHEPRARGGGRSREKEMGRLTVEDEAAWTDDVGAGAAPGGEGNLGKRERGEPSGEERGTCVGMIGKMNRCGFWVGAYRWAPPGDDGGWATAHARTARLVRRVG
jgi:hypothetical protein